ncbi:MAG: hypothetical protein ACQEWV_18945 [Bacillota bacterium]
MGETALGALVEEELIDLRLRHILVIPLKGAIVKRMAPFFIDLSNCVCLL